MVLNKINKKNKNKNPNGIQNPDAIEAHNRLPGKLAHSDFMTFHMH